MKKSTILSILALCAVAMTSCLPDTPGSTYTATFARIVTIDHSTVPPRFYADYTNETFEFSNIKTNADLGKYNLTDVDRALVIITMNAVDYDVDFVLGNGTSPLEVDAVCNKDLQLDDSFGPVYGFSRFEVENSWEYPYAWVSRGYLNIMPVIKSDKTGQHFLVPEGISNDTLSFSLHSKYETGENLRADYLCYDLQTLSDTATADAGAKSVMTAMIDKLNHTSDSVLVVVVADYLNVWPDTVIKTMVPTNYFHLRID